VKPLLSALIVNYQSSTLALRAIESILAQEEEDFKLEVVAVDNCSDDSDKEILRRADLPAHVKRFFLPQNIGYGMGNNFAFEQSSGEYILVINPDTLVYRGTLREMVSYLAHHWDCGAVGPRTYWDEEKTFILPPSEVQSSIHFLAVHLGHYFHHLGHSLDRYWLSHSLQHWRQEGPYDVSMLSGGCLMIRRDIIKAIGLFDPAFKLYFEDTDWCRRARKTGYRLTYLPSAEIAHFYNQSGQKRNDSMELFEKSRSIYFKKYESSLNCHLFPILNRWIARWGQMRKKGLPYSFTELGPLEKQPPALNASENNGCKEYLLEISPGPLFIPAFGAFFKEPIFRFSSPIWNRLGPGRYFARWLALPENRVIGRWTWEKI
jgi:GT2 family glycosyltransferase